MALHHRRSWIIAVGIFLFAGTASAEEAINFAQQHAFSKTEARIRVQQLLDYWSSRFGVKKQWSGDTARVEGMVMGVRFDGFVVVGDHEVSGTANDPGALFRSAAVDYVQRKLRKYLHPQYAER